VRELVLISLLAAFCGGLAWALDHELFAAAFAAAAVVADRDGFIHRGGDDLWTEHLMADLGDDARAILEHGRFRLVAANNVEANYIK
jgi:hypothetical protein